MKIALITVNYNSGKQLLESVKSLYKYTDQNLFDLFIVDNNSIDGSENITKDKFPKIQIIKNNENIGFGRANNIGIKYALKQKNYQYIGLINNDLYFTKNWLKILLKTIKNTQAGAVNPLIVFYDKFYKLPARTNNHYIYLYSDQEKRLMMNNLYKFILINHKLPLDYKKILNGHEFIRMISNGFAVLVNENLKKIKIKIFDPYFHGFFLQILSDSIKKSKYTSFAKKLKRKLIPNSNLPTFEFDIHINQEKYAMYKSEIINSFGGFFNNKELPFDNYYAQELSSLPSKPQKVDYFHGACVLLNSTALKKTGLFDKRYFMYYEDADLGVRMKSMGFEILATPESKVLHKEGASNSKKTLQYMKESRKIFTSKFLNK